MWPPRGGSSPVRVRSSVVFPLPVSPTIPTTLPAGMVKLTFDNTATGSVAAPVCKQQQGHPVRMRVGGRQQPQSHNHIPGRIQPSSCLPSTHWPGMCHSPSWSHGSWVASTPQIHHACWWLFSAAAGTTRNVVRAYQRCWRSGQTGQAISRAPLFHLAAWEESVVRWWPQRLPQRHFPASHCPVACLLSSRTPQASSRPVARRRTRRASLIAEV